MYYISGFYKFKKIHGVKKNKKILSDIFSKYNIRGTIIVSDEGINGTISSNKKNLELVLNKIKKTFNFINFDSQNLSKSKFQIFHRGKVKIKKEVVPMGIKISKRKTKKHLEPDKWNKLISNKKTILVDARKPFEYNVGTFKGSINPEINNFREFPHYLKKLDKNQTIAMFCTGGIRCEKASSYMIAKGFKNVSQLNGGILKYLEMMPESKSLWRGECFVFDGRVSLKNELKQGTYKICHACREPISLVEMKSKNYLPGISCPKCFNKTSLEKKKRLMERNKQISIAKKRGMYNRFIKQTVTDYE